MHVQFEFTQEDLVEATQRFLARSKVVRSGRLKGMLATAVLAWLLVFTLSFRTPAKGAILGLIAAVVSALFYPTLHKRAVEKRLRKFHREKLGNKNSFLCEVELTPAGFSVKSMDRETTYEWKAVEELKETQDSVDIFTRDGGGVVVRNRAFASADDRMRFIELASASLNASRS